jgi:hydroxymethylpyrimidine pyrophosphatase-like HAD family hydrolase
MDTYHNTLKNKAVAVDLDGTLVHTVPGEYVMPGRSRDCYVSRNTVILLSRISQQIPTFITTGRNAPSVRKLTDQIPEVHFAGFVLENGFVVKKDIKAPDPQKKKWKFADKVPQNWELISGYERSAGFILPKEQNMQNDPEELVRNLLQETQEQGYICFQYPKIFVYPQKPDKMQGLAEFNVHPHIALGNDVNDTQLMQACIHPVTLQTPHSSIRELVKRKYGYCSSFTEHAAAEDMLHWACGKLSSISS